MINYLSNTNAVTYALEASNRLLLHVVNAQGVMGSGIAKEVRERIPMAYENYRYQFSQGNLILGAVSDDWNDSDINVINMCAQYRYGYDGNRYLNYGALADCLGAVLYNYTIPNTEIVIPYKMGCDRAGGNWVIVKEMLEYYFDSRTITVCNLGEYE